MTPGCPKSFEDQAFVVSVVAGEFLRRSEHGLFVTTAKFEMRTFASVEFRQLHVLEQLLDVSTGNGWRFDQVAVRMSDAIDAAVL